MKLQILKYFTCSNTLQWLLFLLFELSYSWPVGVSSSWFLIPLSWVLESLKAFLFSGGKKYFRLVLYISWPRSAIIFLKQPRYLLMGGGRRGMVLRDHNLGSRVLVVAITLVVFSSSFQWTDQKMWFFFFFYFWLCWVFVAACRLSLVAASGGYYSSLQCVGFSLWQLLLLWSTGCRRAGFRSCGTQAQ